MVFVSRGVCISILYRYSNSVWRKISVFGADLHMHVRSSYAIFMVLRKTNWPFTKFLILKDSVFWIWRGAGCGGKGKTQLLIYTMMLATVRTLRCFSAVIVSLLKATVVILRSIPLSASPTSCKEWKQILTTERCKTFFVSSLAVTAVLFYRQEIRFHSMIWCHSFMEL